MTESYPVRYGKNPRAFLYSVQNIIDYKGFVKVFPDNDMELLVDLNSDRMQEAMSQIAENYFLNREYTEDELFEVVEYIGDIVYQVFGQYNMEYLRIGERFSKGTDSAIVGRARYNAIYGEDDGDILRISDIDSDTFLCPEFAAVTGVLCHYIGLNAYIVRCPVALGTQQNYTSPSVYAGHSTVIITDKDENILCLVETSTLSHLYERPHLWQTTIAPLVSMTLQNLLDGTLFVGCSYYTYTIMMMGDPIGLNETDYFTHSQYEGIDKTIRTNAVERLYSYYQSQATQIIEDSQYFIIKRWLDLDEDKAQHLSKPYLNPSAFQKRRIAFVRNGYWVAEWLMLRLYISEMDAFIADLTTYFSNDTNTHSKINNTDS